MWEQSLLSLAWALQISDTSSSNQIVIPFFIPFFLAICRPFVLNIYCYHRQSFPRSIPQYSRLCIGLNQYHIISLICWRVQITQYWKLWKLWKWSSSDINTMHTTWLLTFSACVYAKRKISHWRSISFTFFRKEKRLMRRLSIYYYERVSDYWWW